ncbi:hypothetical protein [Deinococcus hopiensis]|nr:hypothetical protein [Deinococcus hopiensis]
MWPEPSTRGWSGRCSEEVWLTMVPYYERIVTMAGPLGTGS